MKKYTDGKYVELTQAEIAKMEEANIQIEKEYWTNIDYAEAVEHEIRKEYTASDEFAILRQRDEKPEEYAKYYAYCEECKAYVKSKKGI